MDRTKDTGVRFRCAGIVEQALQALADTPRHQARHETQFRYLRPEHRSKNLHLDRMRDDAIRADRVLHQRLDAQVEASQAFAVTVDDRQTTTPATSTYLKAQLARDQADFNVELATRAVKVVDQRQRDGRWPAGRASEGLDGPAGLLARERDARLALQAARDFIATGQKLPIVSKHDAWWRMRFPHYIGSIQHQRDQWDAWSTGDLVTSTNVDVTVQAFFLYVNFEAARNGIPIVSSIHGMTLRIEHALYRNCLPPPDLEDVANFVLHAAKRLRLTVTVNGQCRFSIASSSTAIDYKHIVRNLREKSHKDPFDDDDVLYGEDELPDKSPSRVYPAESMAAWMDAERISREAYNEAYSDFLLGNATNDDHVWQSPLNRQADFQRLPIGLQNLFSLVGTFDKVPPIDLDKRATGNQWWTAVGDFKASRNTVAAEIFDSAKTGDLNRLHWCNDHVLSKLADDDRIAAVGIAAQMLRRDRSQERHSPTSDDWPVSPEMQDLIRRVLRPTTGQPPARLDERTTDGPVPAPPIVIADLYVAAMLQDIQRCGWIEHFYLSPLADDQRDSVFAAVRASIDRANEHAGEVDYAKG